MNPKLPCRSVVSPTPKLSEERYSLRLGVVPCRYLTSPSPSFQPISPSPSSHISSVAVPHLLRHHIHLCCPASPQPCSYAAVFTSELVCHPHYPGATIRHQVGSCPLLIFDCPSSHISSVAFPHLLCRRIHTFCPASPPPCSSDAVFTADLFCHPHYPASPPRLRCHPPASLLWSLSHYIPLLHVSPCHW